MKDLLQIVKQSEVRNAESLKLLHDRNSELTGKMVDILNQTARAQAQALIDERIANLERELQAKVKEANEQRISALEMHRITENETQSGCMTYQYRKNGSSVSSATAESGISADLANSERALQATVQEVDVLQSRYDKMARINENEFKSTGMAHQYRGSSSMSNSAMQSNISVDRNVANLDWDLHAKVKEKDSQENTLGEMHRMKENQSQSKSMEQEYTRESHTIDAATQNKISADRIASLERKLQAKVKEADEQQSKLRELYRMKEIRLQSGITAQKYQGSSAVSNAPNLRTSSAERNDPSDHQEFISGRSATSMKRPESKSRYEIQDPLRMSETKAALQRQAESKLEAGLENLLLESERSDSTNDRPELSSRSSRHFHGPAGSRWKEDGSKDLNVHFPNSLWQNDFLGEKKSVYFREQCAAWDRRLTAEISAAIPTFEQGSVEYRHDAKIKRKDFDYSMPKAPWDENYDFRDGDKFGYEDQNVRRRELFRRPNYYSGDRNHYDGSNMPGDNLELRSDNSYIFPPAASHGANPRFQAELRNPLDDVQDGRRQTLKQRTEQVGQDIEEARQRVESAREALAIVVEDAARKGEHAERLKAALDEIREIRYAVILSFHAPYRRTVQIQRLLFQKRGPFMSYIPCNNIVNCHFEALLTHALDLCGCLNLHNYIMIWAWQGETI
jgi:predicted house-cleaning NTP pyrophosphatase (Maf/HAM1 superfamily)